jgi:hypothetical protein
MKCLPRRRPPEPWSILHKFRFLHLKMHGGWRRLEWARILRKLQSKMTVGTMTIAWPGTSIEWRNDQVIDSLQTHPLPDTLKHFADTFLPGPNLDITQLFPRGSLVQDPGPVILPIILTKTLQSSGVHRRH